MNNLCCKLDPMTQCLGCGGQWCRNCNEDTDNWHAWSSNHPMKRGYWRCPVSGPVDLKDSQNGICTVGPIHG